MARKTKLISTQIEEVKPNGSIRTKKPSTVSLAVDHRMAIDLGALALDFKQGHKLEDGLVGIELYAVYEDGKAEIDVPENLEPMSNLSLEGA